MAKKEKTSKKTLSSRERAAAARAASESLNQMREEELENQAEAEKEFENPGGVMTFAIDNPDVAIEDDIFTEGFKRAQFLGQGVRFHIKKNSEFLCAKDHPYSWEKLQQEYGGGYYQVIAKARGTGQILKQQTESIATPDQTKSVSEEPSIKADPNASNMSIIAMLTQIQERADERASRDSRSGENSMATVMTAMMTMMNESSKLMMQQQQESNRQFQAVLLQLMQKPSGPDPMVTLLTKMVTEKPNDGGFTMQGVMKMVADAETKAEQRANRIQEQIEKKADALSDIKVAGMDNGSEGEEKGLTGMIKGLIPVIAQMVTAQQGVVAAQPTPQQIMEAQMNEERRRNPGLNTGFAEDPLSRPAISGSRPGQPRNVPPKQPVRQPQATATAAAPQNVPLQVAKTVEVVSTPGSQVQNVTPITQEPAIDSRLKGVILDMCLSDIGNALLNGEPASKTAELLLVKLEKDGIARQTVAKLFTLEDFMGLARKYMLPPEATPWIKEFHETIASQTDEALKKSSESTRTAGAPASASSGNGAIKKQVASSGGSSSGTGAGTQSRGRSPSI